LSLNFFSETVIRFVMDIQHVPEFSFLASCTCTLDSRRGSTIVGFVVASAMTVLRETNVVNGYTTYKSV